MNKFYFALLLLLIIYSSDLFSQSFLPLELGNKWIADYGHCSGSPTYSSGCSKDTLAYIVTSDSLMPEGSRYFNVSGISIGPFEWFRSDTNFIYVYNIWNNSEIPLFNLHSKEGESFIYGSDSSQSTLLKSRRTITIFNEETEVLEFILDTGLDIAIELSVSSKFGFIKYNNIGFGGWSHSNLIGCVINGNTYGYITDVKNNRIEVPGKIELFQNYPNPFNPTTRIQYAVGNGSVGNNTISREQLVTLKVYDILGNEVAVLVNEYKSPGYYEVEFSAGNLSSGIYFYQLQANEFVSVKKLVLLK